MPDQELAINGAIFLNRILISTIFMMTITTPLFADDITIPMPAETKAEHVDAAYQCGSEKVSVTYINAGSVNLARLSIGNTVIIASNVISASGAKYVGGPYVWWSKGSEAELYDLMRDPEMNAPTQCNTVKN